MKPKMEIFPSGEPTGPTRMNRPLEALMMGMFAQNNIPPEIFPWVKAIFEKIGGHELTIFTDETNYQFRISVMDGWVMVPMSLIPTPDDLAPELADQFVASVLKRRKEIRFGLEHGQFVTSEFKH